MSKGLSSRINSNKRARAGGMVGRKWATEWTARTKPARRSQDRIASSSTWIVVHLDRRCGASAGERMARGRQLDKYTRANEPHAPQVKDVAPSGERVVRAQQAVKCDGVEFVELFWHVPR